MLPAFHLPLVSLGFIITPKMPAGRSPLFHHAFPILSSRPPPGQQQEYVDVFKQQKCEGWSLSIDIGVQSDKTNPLGTAVRGAAEAAAAAAAQGGGLARCGLGGGSVCVGGGSTMWQVSLLLHSTTSRLEGADVARLSFPDLSTIDAPATCLQCSNTTWTFLRCSNLM